MVSVHHCSITQNSYFALKNSEFYGIFSHFLLCNNQVFFFFTISTLLHFQECHIIMIQYYNLSRWAFFLSTNMYFWFDHANSLLAHFSLGVNNISWSLYTTLHIHILILLHRDLNHYKWRCYRHLCSGFGRHTGCWLPWVSTKQCY